MQSDPIDRRVEKWKIHSLTVLRSVTVIVLRSKERDASVTTDDGRNFQLRRGAGPPGQGGV